MTASNEILTANSWVSCRSSRKVSKHPSVQLGADSSYATEAGGSPGTCNFGQRHRIQVSLSPKHHPIWRSTDGVSGKLRSVGDGMSRGKLCFASPWFWQH